MRVSNINRNRLAAYYWLAKPGIIYGNLLTATAGFIYACHGSFHFGLYLAAITGIGLIIACGCVINNYFDRGLDAKMSRTKGRAFVTGDIKTSSGIIYGVLLGVFGFSLLILYTNTATVITGVVGLVGYVALYGYAKRKTSYGTLIGTISGATPPVAGYVAVTGNFDTVAALLFLVLVFWQMPHFYAIALYRLKDYKAAHIPVLPITNGIPETIRSSILYIAAFILTTISLSVRGYTGIVFAVVMGLVGGLWFRYALSGLHTSKTDYWARRVFRISLVVLLVFSIMLSLDHWLP